MFQDLLKNTVVILTMHTGWPKKLDHFCKCITPVYYDVGRHSLYQNVQLFIRSKIAILNVTIFILCISLQKR